MGTLVERVRMDRKIISVSGKRQITIPLKFYEQLRLSKEVECFIENGALIIRPLSQDNGEFSVEILKELVAQGYSGEELIRRFELQKQSVKEAIDIMIEEADDVAIGKRKGATMADVFGED